MTIPFACDLRAIPAAERAAHHHLTRRLMSKEVEEIQEMPDGFGFSFRFAAEEYEAVTQFVFRERLCCPFLQFTLEVTPARGPLWLHLSGPAGVKPFIQAELQLPQP